MSKYVSNKMWLAATFLAATIAGHAGNQQEMKPVGCTGANLCPIYPAIQSHDIHFDIGFILEQVRMTGTDLGQVSGSPFNTLPQNVDVLRPHFKLAWGLTAGLGYHFEHDHWFLHTRFDWLEATGKQNYDCTDSQKFVPTGVWTPTMANGSSLTYFTSVADELEVNYYMLEADLNRGFYVTGQLAFEPHAGVKAGWIFYKNKANFSGGVAGTDNRFYHKQKTNFWGAGPELGLDTKWGILGGLQLFCDSSFALLIGESRVKDEAWYNSNEAHYQTTALEKPCTMAPVVRNTMGFQYSKIIFDGTQNIRARIALDTSYYWSQFQNFKVINEATTSKFFMAEGNSFGLIGLLVDIGWDY